VYGALAAGVRTHPAKASFEVVAERDHMGFLIIDLFIALGIKWMIDGSTEGPKTQKKRSHKAASDQKYIEAMFTLDAAEQGFFWPGGERVFDELDEPYYDEYYE